MSTATKQSKVPPEIVTTLTPPPAPPVAAPEPEPTCQAVDWWTLWITLACIALMWVVHLFQFFGVLVADLLRALLW